jgi:hypothetical protein
VTPSVRRNGLLSPNSISDEDLRSFQCDLYSSGAQRGGKTFLNAEETAKFFSDLNGSTLRSGDYAQSPRRENLTFERSGKFIVSTRWNFCENKNL